MELQQMILLHHLELLEVIHLRYKSMLPLQNKETKCKKYFLS
jgi:hypothetical protein